MTEVKSISQKFNGPLGDLALMQAVDCAAAILNAQRAPGNIPGLWVADGYPELTTNQLLTEAASLQRSVNRYSSTRISH